jgi:hypothetical protein
MADLYRLPDWITEPGRMGPRYGGRCAFYVGGRELVVDVDLLEPVEPATVPSGVEGHRLGIRHPEDPNVGVTDAP